MICLCISVPCGDETRMSLRTFDPAPPGGARERTGATRTTNGFTSSSAAFPSVRRRVLLLVSSPLTTDGESFVDWSSVGVDTTGYVVSLILMSSHCPSLLPPISYSAIAHSTATSGMAAPGRRLRFDLIGCETTS